LTTDADFDDEDDARGVNESAMAASGEGWKDGDFASTNGGLTSQHLNLASNKNGGFNTSNCDGIFSVTETGFH
jgi:hypothetical protein